MSYYRVRMWCRDCRGEDSMGCFGGGSEYIHKDGGYDGRASEARLWGSAEQAEDAAWDEMDGAPWDFEVETSDTPDDARSWVVVANV